MTTIRTADGSSTALDATIVGRITPVPDLPLRDAAAALAGQSARLLPRSIRSYARRSRAIGVTVHDVVKNLIDVARDASPDDPTLARRSSDIAQCAIEAYFEAPDSAAFQRESNARRRL